MGQYMRVASSRREYLDFLFVWGGRGGKRKNYDPLSKSPFDVVILYEHCRPANNIYAWRYPAALAGKVWTVSWPAPVWSVNLTTSSTRKIDSIRATLYSYYRINSYYSCVHVLLC